MNEQQRQQYLTLMGIQSWYSRFIFPAAKLFNISTKLREKPILLNKKHAVKHVSSNISEKQHLKRTSPCETMTEWLEPPNRTINKIEINKTAQINTNNGRSVEHSVIEKHGGINDQAVSPFQIAAISVSDDILVVLDLPTRNQLVDSRARQDHKHLILSILFALKCPCLPVSQWHQDMISWPLPGCRTHTSEKDASDAVYGFLKNRFGLQRKRRVLIFGPLSARYVMQTQHHENKEYGSYKTKTEVVWNVTYAIDQILQLPHLKAEVWMHIDPYLSEDV